MSMALPKTRTCRYWALGPFCPNILRGVDRCQYAHYDTGLLASHMEQRGTCKFWLQGHCRNAACFFEHRDTGVPGLYQGPLMLTGLTLDIANAAHRAGFNTWNHVGLFDLIWAVKRYAIQIKGIHPCNTATSRTRLYSDRYRPSGIGDNTRRKLKQRKKKRAKRNDVCISPPPFYPVIPLKRNAITNANNNDNSSDTKQTRKQAEPILIDFTDDDEKKSPTKRPKLTDESSKKLVAENRLPSDQKLSRNPSMSSEMRLVEDELNRAQLALTYCQSAMRNLFDQHATTLCVDTVYGLLGKLAENITAARNGVREGLTSLGATIEFVKEK